ncbi:AraC family transcriptional regulator [Paenibacillus sp. J5C_2022]|uniref:AraC family transcriptional regulator n=1 Tax=Paenibacillus sp. J5C2022 TaxID=2977129 RepID=UPI0021D06B87|nr:AraC family transcriptional regulator [Paenibacillus sp. J5C2022]MCU6709895.1 AraC family transcriptional regulator [Paenibacillus sp. J5C2022]
MMRKPPRLLIRLMVISIFVGAIPVLALGSFSYYLFMDRVEDQVDQRNSQLLTETQMRLEQLYTTIDFSLTQLANSTLLQDSTEWDYSSHHFQSFNELSSQLYRMQTMEMGISNVFYVSFAKGWLLDNHGAFLLSEHADRDLYVGYRERNEKSFWVTQQERTNTAVKEGVRSESDIAAVTLVKRTPLHAMKPTGMLGVQIPRYEIERRLSSDDNRDARLLIDADLHILAASESFTSQWNQLPAEFAALIKGTVQPGSPATFKFDNSHLAVVSRSAYNNWYYVSVYSNAEIAKDAGSIRNTMFLTCFLVLLLTLLIAMAMNRRFYKPIRKLYDSAVRLSDSQTDNKYNEIELIEARLESLMETQHGKDEFIAGQVSQLRDLFLFKLLIGEVNPAEAEARSAYYRLNAEWKQCCIVSLLISNWKRSRYRESDRDLMMMAVKNVMGELIPASNSLPVVTIGQCQVIVVGSMHETSKQFREYVESLIVMIRAAVERYLGLDAIFGISRSIHSLKEASRAYLEATEALKQKSVIIEQSFFFFEDLTPDRMVRIKYPAALEKALIEAIEENDHEQARESLRLISRYLLEANVSYRELQLYLVRLLVTLLTDSLDSEEFLFQLLNDQKTIFDQLFELNSLDEIESWIVGKVLTPFIQWREEQSQKQYYIITEQMRRIIHEQYKTDLTLEACAEQLKYHPDYLRRVFRKGTGVSFSDYLAQHRLSISKELLENTDWTILDIAQQLNFQNSQNFIRYFKKMVGITPGQYRQSLRE